MKTYPVVCKVESKKEKDTDRQRWSSTSKLENQFLYSPYT